MNNKVLIIAGMHRSGTSLITQWLHKCGLHVGENLLGADVGNDDGHFEDLDFLHLHESFFSNRQLPISGLTSQPVASLSAAEKERLQALIGRKNSRHQWGWKDPRTCLFLPAYKELLPDAFYLVILRDYQSTVSSLINRIYHRTVKKYSTRKGLSKFIWEHFKKSWRKPMLCRKHATAFLKIWLHYNEALLQHLQSLPREKFAVVHHARLIENSDALFLQLVKQGGFSLQYTDFKKVYKQTLVGELHDIASYVKDKSLLARAKAVDLHLQHFIDAHENGYSVKWLQGKARTYAG